MKGVCLFGGYDPAYPRNHILIEGLRLAGMPVTEARVRDRRAAFRYPALAAAFDARARRADTVLVPCFRHKDVPLARLLAGSRRLVFDPLVSRWDTLVRDWGRHREGSLQARWNRAIDALALGTPDVVLCDTWAHGELFESLGARRSSLRRVLVGAEEVFFAVPPPPPAEPVRIVYVGGFLPLHGIDVVLEAAALLERRQAEGDAYEIHLIGDGMGYDRARARARELDLRRLTLTGPCAYASAPARLAESHVVLGAFGVSGKAGRVIPHKVYQGLAAGRAVVSGDGPGVREVFEPERHLVTVPRGDAPALAEALGRLIADPARRARLGAAGSARARELATPERIGRDLIDAIAKEASR